MAHDPIDPRYTGPVPVYTTETDIYFTQANLASLLHITKQTVSYHLRQLRLRGKLTPRDIIIRTAATRAGSCRHTVHYPLRVALAVAERVRAYLPAECAAGMRAQLMTDYPQLFPLPKRSLTN